MSSDNLNKMNIEKNFKESENIIIDSKSRILNSQISSNHGTMQTHEMYPWNKFKPSLSCRCLSFATQLVIIASLGSFIYGFNMSLLNTALDTIVAEYKICKPVNILASTYSNCIDVYGSKNCDAACNWDSDIVICKELVISDCPERKWWVAGVQSALLVGSAIGALSAGPILKYGRRTLMLIVMFISVIGTISSMVSTGMVPLLWARLLTGLGVGMSSVSSPTYISEVAPSASRGFYGVFHQLAITIGLLIPMLLGLPLAFYSSGTLTTFHSVWWRMMLGFGLIPVFIFMYYIYFYSFETPVWYIENHRIKDAEKLLQLTHNKSEVSEELNSLITNSQNVKQYKEKKITYLQLFTTKKYRLVSIVGVGLAVFQQFGGINYFMMNSKESFTNVNLNSEMAHIMTIIMSFINMITTFPAIYLIEKSGRRSLLLWGSIGQCIFLLPATISYWFEKDYNDISKTTQILSVILVIGFVMSFSLAFGPVVWVYLFEIYPIEIKDTAASLATAANWTAAIIIVFVAQVIPNIVGYTLFTLFQILATLFIFFLMRESKHCLTGTSPYIDSMESTV